MEPLLSCNVRTDAHKPVPLDLIPQQLLHDGLALVPLGDDGAEDGGAVHLGSGDPAIGGDSQQVVGEVDEDIYLTPVDEVVTILIRAVSPSVLEVSSLHVMAHKCLGSTLGVLERNRQQIIPT